MDHIVKRFKRIETRTFTLIKINITNIMFSRILYLITCKCYINILCKKLKITTMAMLLHLRK